MMKKSGLIPNQGMLTECSVFGPFALNSISRHPDLLDQMPAFCLSWLNWVNSS